MPTTFGKMYEYIWRDETKNWTPWKTLVPAYEYNPELKFTQILVPTVDTEKTTWILKLMDKVNNFLRDFCKKRDFCIKKVGYAFR